MDGALTQQEVDDFIRGAREGDTLARGGVTVEVLEVDTWIYPSAAPKVQLPRGYGGGTYESPSRVLTVFWSYRGGVSVQEQIRVVGWTDRDAGMASCFMDLGPGANSASDWAEAWRVAVMVATAYGTLGDEAFGVAAG